MAGSGRRHQSLHEDEIMLAEMEGAEVAEATVNYARERRRRRGLERWAQLQRIADVHDIGEPGAFEDVRLRVLCETIGYMDERVWRDTLETVRRHVLEDPDGKGWFPELAERRNIQERLGPELHVDGEPLHPINVDEEALFKPDRHAISDMTIGRSEALARAQTHLAAEGSNMIVDQDYVRPNPYQDLWLVGYIDPQHPDATIDGGGPIVVPAQGETYTMGGGPGRPRELVGAILPPDHEWGGEPPAAP